MTDQEIRDLLAEQLLCLRTAARTHDHPRVQTAVSREMTGIAQVLLGTDAQAQDTTAPEVSAKLGELREQLVSAQVIKLKALERCASCGGDRQIQIDMCSLLSALGDQLEASQALAEGLVRDAE